MVPELTGSLTAMPDEQTRVLSRYGIAGIVFGVIALAATALGVMVWTGHRADVVERTHQSEVLQAAVDWTALLINMNSENAPQNLQQLRDGTVGQLNVDFDATMTPFADLVGKLKSQTVGQVESVSIESMHRVPDGAKDTDAPPAELATVASRTDTVLVVATSVSQNAGAQPTTVRWNLRLGVSDIDGSLLISRLETIR
ncbi:hypothetical protein BN1047_01665 [Mycolicibacterium neoaurum]|uniref:Mce associated membrane protein n=2 Tax=Mycobacteriaceae TaxID=1762 RepID=A0AAV2WHR4_MYCNE|nr:hypothetical protein BN1047_01665 [Mycolicibacterium neoaurum]